MYCAVAQNAGLLWLLPGFACQAAVTILYTIALTTQCETHNNLFYIAFNKKARIML
jgi:hypothetical protein